MIQRHVVVQPATEDQLRDLLKDAIDGLPVFSVSTISISNGSTGNTREGRVFKLAQLKIFIGETLCVEATDQHTGEQIRLSLDQGRLALEIIDQ